MRKEITKEELKFYKSSLKQLIDGKAVDPFPYLPLEEQLAIYIKEQFFWFSAKWGINPHTGNYFVENKYANTLSDPRTMKWTLDFMAKNKLLSTNLKEN